MAASGTSSLSLNTYRDADCTTYVVSPLQSLVILSVTKSFLMSYLNLSREVMFSCSVTPVWEKRLTPT